MSTSQAEKEARKYLGHRSGVSEAEYDRAVRKAAASIRQLHQAVQLAAKQQSA
jgi:hypothetical protein